MAVSSAPVLPFQNTYRIRFSCHVEGPPFEFGEVFKEDRHKGCDIYSSVFSSALEDATGEVNIIPQKQRYFETNNRLSIIRV